MFFTFLFYLAAGIAASIGVMALTVKALRTARQYKSGKCDPGQYWPIALLALIGDVVMSALVVTFVGFFVVAAWAPKQQYAEGAGIAVLFAAIMIGVCAGVLTGFVLIWPLVLGPLLGRRRLKPQA